MKIDITGNGDMGLYQALTDTKEKWALYPLCSYEYQQEVLRQYKYTPKQLEVLKDIMADLQQAKGE